MASIKLAMADDHSLFRKGMGALFDRLEDIELVLEAENGKQLLDALEDDPVDVVLMDIDMPDMDGLKTTNAMKVKHPKTAVIILSGSNEDEMVLSAVDAGAKGYLLKDANPDEVEDAVRSVVENGFYFNDDISKVVLRGMVEKDKLSSKFNPQAQLTERELDVLRLVCKEMTNNEIGKELFLSPRTVESYRKNMLEKIGARNTVGLVVYAIKHKLVEME